jgi:hypothetical protein
MKTLYFDINGTLTFEYTCKPALAHGAFEREVRSAGFERLVCVSSFQKNIEFLEQMGEKPDALAIIFDACFGAFADLARFRKVTTITADANHRGRSIDLSGDWWYIDDQAERYLADDNLDHIFESELNRRVFMPRSNSDGSDVLHWLRTTTT